MSIASGLLDIVQQPLDHIKGLQDRIDDWSFDGHLTLAHFVHNAFRMMGDLDEPRETQKPGRAFHAVRRTENFI